MASNRAIDSQPRFEQLQQDIGGSNGVTKRLLERGYATASDFAFSLPDAESLELLMQGVMRDDQLPRGGILQNPDIMDATIIIHPESGRIRRLYAECKALATPRPYFLQYHLGDLGRAHRVGGSTSPNTFVGSHDSY